jgi:hypothetical protein
MSGLGTEPSEVRRQSYAARRIVTSDSCIIRRGSMLFVTIYIRQLDDCASSAAGDAGTAGGLAVSRTQCPSRGLDG